MKCKLDIGAGVSIMPLSIYQYINPSEFDKQGKPIDGYGQYRTIIKDYTGNPIQQYGIRVILGKWNHQYWRFAFHIIEAEGPHMAWTEYNEENGALHKAPKSFNLNN